MNAAGPLMMQVKEAANILFAHPCRSGALFICMDNCVNMEKDPAPYAKDIQYEQETLYAQETLYEHETLCAQEARYEHETRFNPGGPL
jgi:hypothetical protein